MSIVLSKDKLSVVVFGPGFGEAIMVHAPPDTWLVIDGCTVDRKSPVARLLAEHNAAWSGVIFTHPHLDHARGLAEVLAQAGNGPIGCASLELPPVDPDAADDPELTLKRGVAEHVLAVIEDCWQRNAGTQWRMSRGQTRTIGPLTLTVLNPHEGTPRGAGGDPNRLAAAVSIAWNGHMLVLGSDVLTEDWAAIAEELPGLGAHVVLKVPHHASRSGMHAAFCMGGRGRTWIATPWNKGTKLPRFEAGENVAAILAHVDLLHLTGLPIAHELQHEAPCHATRGELAAKTRPRFLTVPMEGLPHAYALDVGSGKDWATNYVVIEIAGDGATRVRYGPGSVVVTE